MRAFPAWTTSGPHNIGAGRRYDEGMTGWRLEHTYATLPALFHTPVQPTPVSDPAFVIFNTPLAVALGLDPHLLHSSHGAEILGGNAVPADAHPLAQAYAGHQFGHFTALGDGRAILLGEQRTPDAARVDIQLKGAGPTPYSRNGDGRAAVGPMLRELIISEAMHALGVPTSRSLAVVATGDAIYRERPLPGAVLTRVAASHLRVGTFQWAAAHRDVAALRALADYTVRRHFPEADTAANPPLAMFDAIVERQAALIAQWQLVGFVHGVMNTDNMAISGETLDYGPCAFIDAYDPDAVFSSIDSQGRYAYGNQPAIAQWNLARLAEALLPLFDVDQTRAVEMASASVARFSDRFDHYWLSGIRAKLGLVTHDAEDAALAHGLLTWMHETGADFTNTFRHLSMPDAQDTPLPHAAAEAWRHRWIARLGRQPLSPVEVSSRMQRHNPAVIPRNHKVEEALAAAERGDVTGVQALLDALANPYDHTRIRPDFTPPPPSGGRRYRTFCGT